MHIDKPASQGKPLQIADPLALGHLAEGQGFRLAVVKHRPAVVTPEKPLDSSPAAGFPVLLPHQ